MTSSTGTSWTAPAVLLIKPWRLGRVALATGPVPATLAGVISYGLPLAGFVWLIGISVHEPWGWWYRVREEAVAQLPCFIVPLSLITVAGIACTVSTRRSVVRSAHTRCVLLAPVFVFIPLMVWLATASFLVLNGDVMSDDRWDTWAESTVLNLLGSCFVPPVIGFVWMVILGHGFVKMDELLDKSKHLCHSCGYDLRGTRAAGIERCPECGAKVEPLGDDADRQIE